MKLVAGIILSIIFVGCSNSQVRQEQREKIAASSGMYCEFLSGDRHADIDVELNLQMGKRCDPAKPYTMTNFKNSSENYGIVYCCGIKGKGAAQTPVETRHFGPKEEPKPAEPPPVQQAQAEPPAKPKPSTTRTAPSVAPASAPSSAPASAPSKPVDKDILAD